VEGHLLYFVTISQRIIDIPEDELIIFIFVKRSLIIIAVILLSATQDSIDAQTGEASPHYQMILSDRISFFEGDYNQINCIRIDSALFKLNLIISNSDTISYTEDSVFFPMANIQYESDICANPYGASWIGEKVVIQQEGDHLFFNKNEDTIRIRASASVGETWKVFESESRIVKATVLENEPISFLGLTDSVKTIGFQVYDKVENPLSHDLNKKTIRLSKHYGAVRILNFYQFPDIFQLNYGYWGRGLTIYNLVGLSVPEVGVQNLSWFDVFDFQPGDEIHTLLDKFSWYEEGSGSAIYEQTIKRFLTRTDFADSIVYAYERKISTLSVVDTTPSLNFIHDTAVMVIRPNPEFEPLPGEVIIEGNRAYAHSMTGGNWVSKRVPSIAERVDRSGDDYCWTICCFDGCFMNESYYGGLGGPYGSCTEAFVFGKTEYRLTYFKKETHSWGTPHEITGVERVNAPSSLRIYPNPASDYTWIESATEPIKVIYLLDLGGRVVLEHAPHSNAVRLDLSHLSPGIYFLRAIVEGEVLTSRFVKE